MPSGRGDRPRGAGDGRVAAVARRRCMGRERVRGGSAGAGCRPSRASRHWVPAYTAPGQVRIYISTFFCDFCLKQQSLE